MAKNNNKLNWFLTYWYVWVTLIVAVFTIATTGSDVKTTVKAVEINSAEIKEIQDVNKKQDIAIIEIKTDIKYIKETVDKIDKKL